MLFPKWGSGLWAARTGMAASAHVDLSLLATVGCTGIRKREVLISTCCVCSTLHQRALKFLRIQLGPLLPFRSVDTHTTDSNHFIQPTLFFNLSMLGTWFFFPLLQRFSRHQKLLKTLFKTSKGKKFRHSPTYSISDFTRKCRRSGNGHNWDYYWHQEGRQGGHHFFYPRVWAGNPISHI